MVDFFNDFFDAYMYKNKENIRFKFLNFYYEKLELFL
jgi:hypothetical protein